MKTYTILLSAGLASAQVLNNGLNLNANALLNGSFDSGASSLDPAALGLNLNDLNVQGLDVNNLDFNNQESMAQAIQALLGNLCLNNALDINSIQNLGLNNEVDLFLQLAQLQQLQSLGFLTLGGVNNLFSSGLLLGGFNVGVFKREVEKAKKSMTRMKLRRGAKVTKRQCQQANQQGVNSVNSAEDGTVTIATAPVASVASATAASKAASKATSVASVASATQPAAAAATNAAAVVSNAPAASVAPAAAAPAPAAAVSAQPAASVAPAVAVPEAAPAAAPSGGENLADFTR